MTESTETPTEPAADPLPTTAAPEAVELYVCPGCGSWYGSSSMNDLESVPNIRSSLRNLHTEDPSAWGSVTGTRAECQHCKSKGQTVERVKVKYVVLGLVREALAKGVEEAFREEERTSGVKLARPTG